MKMLMINPKSSSPAAMVSRGTGIKRVRHQRGVRLEADFILNYGLVGRRLNRLYGLRPELRGIPTINGAPMMNKLDAVRAALRMPVPRVLAPESDTIGPPPEHLENWLFKPYYSRGGHGIQRLNEAWRNGTTLTNGYMQRYVSDRKYEIRVSGALWMPKEEWGVWKKFRGDVPEDAIAWNHDQGGIFEKVNSPMQYRVFREAIDNTEKMLKLMELQFGACDFLVAGPEKKVWFIEMNRRPGFTAEYGGEFYVGMFKKLLECEPDAIRAMVNGDDIVEEPVVEELFEFPQAERQSLTHYLDSIFDAWNDDEDVKIQATTEEIVAFIASRGLTIYT